MEVPGLDKLRDFKSGKIIVNGAFEKRKCPVCKKAVTKEMGKVDVFPILECERCNLNFCGLVSKNNLGFNINDDRSRRYDANKFRPSKNDLKSEKRFLYRELKGYVDFKRPLKFLDFGSGSGAMIGAALSLNWKAYSVEINPDLRNLVGNLFKVPTYSHIEEIPKTEKFDVVWMSYVVCLLPEPLETFKTVRNYLSKDGVIVISDPNYEGYCVRNNGLLHYYYAHPIINFFKKPSLKYALKKAGFSYISEFKESKFHPVVFLDGMRPPLKYFDKNKGVYIKRTSLQVYMRKLFTSIFFVRAFKVTIMFLGILGFSRINKMGFGNQISVVCRK